MAHGRVPGDRLDAVEAERIGRRFARGINSARVTDLPREGFGALLLSLLDLALYGIWALVLMATSLTALALISEDLAWPWLVLAGGAALAGIMAIVLPIAMGWLSFRRSSRDRLILMVLMMIVEVVLIFAWLAIVNAAA